MKIVLTLEELWQRFDLPRGSDVEIRVQYRPQRRKIDVTLEGESLLRKRSDESDDGSDS